MRVLMVTPRLPYPPDRGDTLRSWFLLEGLAARHEIWLASVCEHAPTPAVRAVLARSCRAAAIFPSGQALRWARGVTSWLAGRSLTAGYFHDPRLVRTLRTWAAQTKFDALLVYSAGLAPAVADVRGLRRILDMCDVDSAKWREYARTGSGLLRPLYTLEARRVAALEAHVAPAADLCFLVNERERQKLRLIAPAARSTVVPTAVTREAFASEPRHAPPPELRVGLVGSMFYPPNVRGVDWFGREVWPRVRAAVPQAQWWLIGARPTRRVLAWRRLPGVTVTGSVPDTSPYLRALRVFICPVASELGVQSKLVVALAAGCPAVVTRAAAGGLVWDPPAPFLVAGDAAEFAAGVVRLLRDDALWCTLSARARAIAEHHYAAARQIARVEEFLAGSPAVRAGPATPARACPVEVGP